MNRGIARRTVFEDRRDARYFLSHLARAVRDGWVEVHAYSVLTTHFHLLVRSSEEGVSRAMGRVLNNYVSWFNRSRRRDGPLFRSRFLSRRIDDGEYLRQVVRYIDANPVEAGLVLAPALYPFGSARWYAEARGPIWLERSWIESALRRPQDAAHYDPRRYAATFGAPLHPDLVRLIERRIESGVRGPDPLDDLLGAAPERVLDWMRRKAALADGTEIGIPVCGPGVVREIVGLGRARRPDWRLRLTRKSLDPWSTLEIALVRDLCAATWPEIGVRLGTSDHVAARAYRRHAEALRSDCEYASAAAATAAAAIARCHAVPGTTPTNSPDAQPCPTNPSESFQAPYGRFP